MHYRLGVDVGGTFTDILLIDPATGRTFRAKTPSTPHDQSVGVLAGIEKVRAEARIPLSEIGQVLHGTTVATNAILEGKGARVGLVTTAGFRQVLQIARSFVPGGLAGWIIWPKPEPLAALEDTVEAVERVASDGSVVTPLDEDALRASLRRLRGVEALAVSLINSYAFDGHERRVAEIAAEELPGVPVSISSAVLPELREYERTITTVANAYVQPQVARYLDNLAGRIAEGGVTGSLNILRSDGGLASASAAAGSPVNLLLSGPAGGVAGATWVAEQAGFPDFLTFDMGGTSTDVALVQGLRPRVGRETRVGDLTVRSASVDVRTVGAGGGSIAHVPELTRALRVGPQSAGADPGPAAYGRGGEEPTVTDANVVLGYLPTRLAGGEIVLDRERSRAAVAGVAEAMGLPSVEAAAQGIVDIVNENMFGALRLVSVQQGFDPRDFALVAFGGAGPLHANALGRLTGSWPVVIPPSPGVLCAYGDATTSLRDEAARTYIRRFSQLTDTELGELLTELAETAARTLEAEGVDRADQSATYHVDVRYHGQGFEIPIPLTPDTGLDALGKAFDAEHERLFSFLLDNEHELVSARAAVSGPRPNVQAVSLAPGGEDPSAAVTETQEIWVEGGWTEAAVHDRSALLAGNVVRGPAIVVEMDSTTLVLPGHAATVHESGSLLIRPLEA
ncbi:hydantoinase/oxoprolinase family protein [Streptosporangium sp. NPDC049644]|uniref:hydantoinase/oxoprolinase family protein n=1 Tax=Streptosporangium sp. NPDC049644 TaxID=3155507 RepID=UPI00341D3E92